MKRVLGISAALLFFLICVIWRAPAWLLVDSLDSHLPPELQLGSASGSLWQGEFSTVQYQGITLEQVSWQLQPIKALQGSPLKLKVKFPVQLDAELGFSQGQLKLNALAAKASLASVLDLAGVPSMGFDGRLSAELSGVFGEQGCTEFDGQLELLQLSGDLAGVSQIAPLRADLVCQGRNINLKIAEDNSAKVRGSVRVPLAGGKPTGSIMVSPQANSELYLSLQDFLGRPRNGKDFIIRL
ncbi:type II secretion system protein N [Spongiibacter sp. KMU-158]|uniref:Type II secretion system protein N n=1 Tax=Spongiibacter pelagi TaxID=2760804 RepID=A0A927GVD5_9GAMM|nr:type II secretion system protein N [Spongiibacter pelagi]MBD2858556.1 type II secretion system protein N [Spongiibacter pelagi]